MSRSSSLFLGIFGAFALSCFVIVLAPQSQLGGLDPSYTEEDGGKISDIYPIANASMEQGSAVYAREGCVYCHSQQIRDPQNGTDIERGWGSRRTVARDYIFADSPLVGSRRMGPDLANVGAADWRNEPKDDVESRPKKRDAAWHYLHLYAPRTIHLSSNQPPYRYLFDVRKISGKRSFDALDISGEDAPKDGYEVVPKPEARALVAYLLSLDRSHPLKEAAAAPAAPATTAPAPQPAAK